jgi:membrane-bound lytic murein transglycosylase D
MRVVKAGSTLVVARGEHVVDDVSERLADTAALNLAPDAPPLRRVSFKAGKGDTLAGIAARYKVRSEQVAQWNKLGSNAHLKPGQAVVIYTASAPASTKVAAAPAARKATSTRAAKVVRVAAKQPLKGKGGKGRNVVAAATP